MADFTQKDLSGSIFKNLKKTTDNQPHMSGSALINGIDYWVSAWTKPADKNIKDFVASTNTALNLPPDQFYITKDNRMVVMSGAFPYEIMTQLIDVVLSN